MPALKSITPPAPPADTACEVPFNKEDYARSIKNELRLDKIDSLASSLRIGVWAIVAASIPIIVEGILLLIK